MIRSDALSGLLASGPHLGECFRVGTVVDLRTAHERRCAPDVLPSDGSVESIWLPIQGGAIEEFAHSLLPSDPSARVSGADLENALRDVPTLDALYVEMLDNSGGQFVEVARSIVAASRSSRPVVVVHCTAGKDRTGLAVALMLLVAGVSRSPVVADYTLSERNIASTIAAKFAGTVAATGVPRTPRLQTLAAGSPAPAMTASLDWLDSELGGAGAYLRSSGLTAAELAALGDALQPRPP